MNLAIRPETTADHAAVHAVHVAAFPTDGEARLVSALRDAGHAPVSLVATLDNLVIGHVLFSPVTIEHMDSGALGLAPVAVLPTAQGRGVGAQLVRGGLAAAAARGVPFCVVLGDPRYYGRFGFFRASDAGLTNEYGVDAEFMVLELTAGGLAGRRGLVRYGAEFNAVGV